MYLNEYLPRASQILVKQVREHIELLGFEGRNRYQIFTADGQLLGKAEEQNQGAFMAIARQLLRHWRHFNIEVVNADSSPAIQITHPFRFYFTRLEVADARGEKIGYMQKHFSILSKKFTIGDKSHNVMEMYAGFFKIWNYPITKEGREVAAIEKKWGGAISEIFTDADTFLIQFKESTLTLKERQLILSAALFIDIMYFDDNNGFNLTSFIPGFGE